MRVALVTGAAQGIGRAFALRFAEAGYAVVIADINGAKADRVAAEIAEAGGTASAIETDVTLAESCSEMAGYAKMRHGSIDVLINDAAVRATERRRFWDIDEALWDRMMAVNVKGTWLAMRAVLPAMRAQGGGCIINISSAAFLSGAPNLMHYNASKGAVIGITRSAARELGEFNIRVNAILPGSVETEIAKPAAALKPEDVAARAQGRIIERSAVPSDLAGVALFLASDAAGYMTGQSLNVDGGQSFV
jgi:3-oxoacyl-[acyl-carrier protein] reductase